MNEMHGMSEEQLTTRYMRGWISLKEYRAELVRFYDREDAREAAERAATVAVDVATALQLIIAHAIVFSVNGYLVPAAAIDAGRAALSRATAS